MIVEREESWGKIIYNTLHHRFSYVVSKDMGIPPYVNEPVLLNVDLTFKCNMDCPHCVAKDFEEKKVDLDVSNKLIDKINESPFLVVVITGGEPLLPEYESRLIKLLTGIRKKGLILDTNGTIIPSHLLIEKIRETNTLVRISWDGVRRKEDNYFRRFRSGLGYNAAINKKYASKKFELVPYLQEAGVNVAAQTVISSSNRARGVRDEIDLMNMPRLLNKYSIRKWYIQKFIPSHKRKDTKYVISKYEYDKIAAKLNAECQKYNIEFIAKKDLRHNCVILLVGEGDLYTQGQEPGQKILLGTIYDSEIRYFDYVSSVDHALRYIPNS